jgi:methylenetetrahydrofolate reductase (NADPH)
MGLREKIELHQFVVCVEIGPPQSCDGDVIRDKSRHFKGFVDAVNVTDNQRAIVRLSSLASAKILLDEGIEPIVQMTCRDRNRLAMQSDLLGAAALGIRNVLCLTGDYQSFGDEPEAKGVFDLDSIQLIAAVANMNSGFLLSGSEMKKPTEFLIGAAANPFAEPFEMRLIRLHKKIAAGAHFIQTQPVFDMGIFTRWMERAVEMGLHEQAAILPGVMPVRSVKTLLWMKEKLPGVRIHNDYISRMSQARDPQEEGIRIAVEMIRVLKVMRGVRGIHIMPLLWESITPTIVKEAGLLVAH